MSSASEFSQAMRVKVPAKIQAAARQFYFDVGAQTYEAVIEDVPVVTGYLRASTAFSVGGENPPEMPEQAKGVQYRGTPLPTGSLKQAVRDFLPWTMGFRAKYGIYVEDSRGMVKNAVARMSEFTRIALGQAHDTSRGEE